MFAAEARVLALTVVVLAGRSVVHLPKTATSWPVVLVTTSATIRVRYRVGRPLSVYSG